MSDLKDFFNERKQEVEVFIQFIEKIEQEATYADEIKILKSQAVLMLYNLIEGTVNKGISCIFDEINDSSLKQEETCEQIRIMWLRYFKLHCDDNGNNQKTLSCINSFIDKKVDIDIGKFRENNPSYLKGGSLDSRAIKEILKKFSIEFSTFEYKLKEVKKERNHLAHGEKSFTEIGQNKSILDVKESKEKVVTFLALYVTEIDQYIDDKLYMN